MTVDVVIPARGRWDVTERCLNSLKRRDRCVNEVVVVDDASSDGSADALRSRGDVRALCLSENVGFGAASNAGAARCSADALLFLNNDTLVPPGSIDRLAAALSADGAIGAAGAKLLYADGSIQSAGCTLTPGATGTWRVYAHLDASLREANAEGDYLYLAGAALLVRRELFQRLGGFDVMYRNGAEDLDLCLRIWREGFRVRYVPTAAIYHIEGASRGKVIDEDRNWRLFTARWRSFLPVLPQYRPPEPPHLIVRWRNRAPVDAPVRAHLARTLRAHLGARAVFADVPGAAPLERLRSAVERRRIVTIGYGTNERCDVSWILPTPDGAAMRRPEESALLWAPTEFARAHGAPAGIDAARISIVRLGFFPEGVADAAAPPAIVTDRTVPDACLQAIVRALAHPRVAIAHLDALTAEMLASLRSAPTVVFAGFGDAWGLIGGERLAAGAAVAAPRGAPFLEAMPPDVALACEREELAEAVAYLRSRPDECAGLRDRARRETLLRAPALYAGARIRELSRARASGVIPPYAVEMTPPIVQAFRALDQRDVSNVTS